MRHIGLIFLITTKIRRIKQIIALQKNNHKIVNIS